MSNYKIIKGKGTYIETYDMVEERPSWLVVQLVEENGYYPIYPLYSNIVVNYINSPAELEREIREHQPYALNFIKVENLDEDVLKIYGRQQTPDDYDTELLDDGQIDEIKVDERYDSVFEIPFNDYVELLFNLQMGSTLFADTMSFQEKYGLHEWGKPAFLSDDKLAVKMGHLDEELAEAKKAIENKNLPEFFDALIDLIYVASGTLNLCNAPSEILWKDVQIKNMQKVRATKDTVGKRGSTFDVVKPEGFIGPVPEKIIEFFSSDEEIILR